MQEIAHTPLPWRITEPNEKKSREIVGANGSTVARLTALDMPNAELIVASVNAAMPKQSQVGNFGDSAQEQLAQRSSSLPLPNYTHYAATANGRLFGSKPNNDG